MFIKNALKVVAVLFATASSVFTMAGQSNLGEACGCPLVGSLFQIAIVYLCLMKNVEFVVVGCPFLLHCFAIGKFQSSYAVGLPQ